MLTAWIRRQIEHYTSLNLGITAVLTPPGVVPPEDSAADLWTDDATRVQGAQHLIILPGAVSPAALHLVTLDVVSSLPDQYSRHVLEQALVHTAGALNPVVVSTPGQWSEVQLRVGQRARVCCPGDTVDTIGAMIVLPHVPLESSWYQDLAARAASTTLVFYEPEVFPMVRLSGSARISGDTYTRVFRMLSWVWPRARTALVVPSHLKAEVYSRLESMYGGYGQVVLSEGDRHYPGIEYVLTLPSVDTTTAWYRSLTATAHAVEVRS